MQASYTIPVALGIEHVHCKWLHPDSIRIQILAANSIRYPIRMKISDSQVGLPKKPNSYVLFLVVTIQQRQLSWLQLQFSTLKSR